MKKKTFVSVFNFLFIAFIISSIVDLFRFYYLKIALKPPFFMFVVIAFLAWQVYCGFVKKLMYIGRSAGGFHHWEKNRSAVAVGIFLTVCLILAILMVFFLSL